MAAIQKCVECGALMAKTPSGVVCARGCGRINPAVARGRKLINALLLLKIESLPIAERHRGGRASYYTVAGRVERFCRVAGWPGDAVQKLVSAAGDGSVIAEYGNKIVALELSPATDAGADRDGRESCG